MTEETPKKDPHKKLKIALDIASGIFFIFLLVIAPIWAHYEPESRGEDGKVLLGTQLIVLDFLPALFGFFWLNARYSEGLNKKFPSLSDSRYQIPYIIGGLAIYGLGYLILKLTLWR